MSVVSIGTSNINMGNQGGLGGTSQLSNLWGGTSSVSLNNIWTAKVYARKTGQSNFGYFYNINYRGVLFINIKEHFQILETDID